MATQLQIYGKATTIIGKFFKFIGKRNAVIMNHAIDKEAPSEKRQKISDSIHKQHQGKLYKNNLWNVRMHPMICKSVL